jgi:RNA polymerase sigma-70 factor (sigma-E family)
MTGEDEFDELFLRLLPMATRVARRLLHDEHAAEDAAAEAFTRAYARWPLLRRHPKREAWVLRVTTNIAIDVLRRKRVDPPLGVANDPAGEVATSIGLGAALRALPRRQREVVTLRYLADLSEREVAAVLDLAEGSVKSHASRGLTSLRSHLGTDAPEVFLHG